MALSKKPGASRPTQDRVHEQVMQTATGYKRLNVPMPADMYRQIQQQALNEDRSIATITRELWARYLVEQGKE